MRLDQVGIKGDTNTDFLNRKTGTVGWTDSLPGTLNTDTMELSQAKLPLSGLTWEWSILVGPNLSLSTKSAPGKVVFGEPIEYTIEILNTGLAPALDASLVDPIPAGTVYNGDVACSSGDCWYDSGVVYWAGEVAGPPKAQSIRAPRAAAGLPVNLSLQAVRGPGVSGPPPQTDAAVNLILDDGSAENFIGLNDGTYGYQYLWLNRFTPDPAELPFQLETISVLFGNTGVPLGGAADLVVYEDTNGGDPSDAAWLATYPVTVQANDGTTWSTYTLATPLTLNGPGDVLIGVINRYEVSGVSPADFPAALDQGVSQVRSWVAAWAGDPPSPPNLPADSLWGTIDSFGFAGNWLVRGSGETVGQPPENPVTVTFSVTPENPECGIVVVNEATINDPQIPEPVVVQAATEVWEMVLLHEDFEGDTFPPAGWVEAHDTAGMAWTDQDLKPRGNLTGGTGKFAIVDDDYGGSAALTTAQLWTPPFDIPADPGYFTQLIFKTDYNNLDTDEKADVDISLDGGATWVNLLHWAADHRGPLTQSVDLTPFAGATGAILRFYYYDGAAFAWWWEIDDVQIVACYVGAPEIDVSPLDLSATLCPDEQQVQTLTICNLGNAPLDWELTEVDEASKANAPTDVGFAQDIGYISDNFVSFPLNDFTGQTVVGTNTNAYYGIDFDPAATTLFALNDTTDQLGTIDLATGAFTGLVSCPPGGGAANWTGLAIDPVSGVFYGSTATQLFTIDPGTGASTLVGTYGVSTMIAIAVNGDGLMYGHDITSDAIYQVDPATGVATLVGSTGYAANYAQGMDFDNQDGTLYIWLYTGSGANVYGTVNLSTGAVTPLAVSAPLGEFEGATQTTAGPPPDYVPWLTEEPLSGTVDPGLCQDVTVTFDSTGLLAGTYNGVLRIDSNDADEPQIDVPVTLIVDECGADTVHIGHIAFAQALDPYGRVVARWNILTHDANHTPLGGVTVDASIWSPGGGPFVRTRVTKFTGWARFHWGYANPGTFLLCVDNLTKPGYTYVPGDNDVPNCAP